MIDFPYIKELSYSTPTKIVMLVVDGLGGLPHPETGMSELETAKLPNLDSLSQQSACGLTTPVGPGITPGSGPGHMALFGYNPLKYLIGRGVLEGLGIGVKLNKKSIAIRGNFCTVDQNGLLIDRRAGRIPTSLSAPLVKLLDQINVPEVNISIHGVKDHRFVLILDGEGLGPNVSDTDPQSIGVAPIKPMALSNDSEKTAVIADVIVSAARGILSREDKANMILLRGFSQIPQVPNMAESYNLIPAAIAAYPMYRGIARLVGMNVLNTGVNFDDELTTLKQNFAGHDFFFLHYKPADTAGEDGQFDNKVYQLEQLDIKIPKLLDINPDVLIIAGDHATPAIMGSHSWHNVPIMIHSSLTLGDGIEAFTEHNCISGSIGRIPAVNVMMTALAYAGKLNKFGP